MRVASADSGAAFLDEQYKPMFLVASVSVLVEPPYREPSKRVAEPIFREFDSAFDVIVHEAQLCQNLLAKVNADEVHLDMTLGGLTIEDLSPLELLNMRASKVGRQNILKILPRLRKIAAEIKRIHGIDMLAIGKESVPLRIAELTAGVEAILYACQRVFDTQQDVLLGLPLKCQPRVLDDHVYLQSLISGEHDLRSYAVDTEKILAKVKLTESLKSSSKRFPRSTNSAKITLER